MTVLLIAAAHAIPVFLVGAILQSRVKLLIAAAIAALVAVAAGHPVYTAIDLFAVAVSTWLGWNSIRPAPTCAVPAATSMRQTYQVPVAPARHWNDPPWAKSNSLSLALIAKILTISFGFLGLMWFINAVDTTSGEPVQTAPAVRQPAMTQPPPVAETVQQVMQPTPPVEPVPGKKDLTHCLNRASNEAIARCTSQ